MQKYNKLWGQLIGSVVMLGVGYGFIPEQTGGQVMTAWNVLIPMVLPIIGGAIGTWRSPKNRD